MKYIGITGHRGSGKTSIAYLLGNILECIKHNKTVDEIKINYTNWCEIIKNDENAIYDCSLDYVYFDEFGDMPKSFVAQLLSIDMNILDDDLSKDNIYVNMKDFTICKQNSSNFKIINSDDILNNSNKSKKWGECYISLREFTKCFSIDIMQRYFGTNVWLKTLKLNDIKWFHYSGGWRLFSDVKTIDELNYIKEKNGIIVRTKRPSKRKHNSGITNIEKCDYDYSISTEGELIDLFQNIYDIAKNIYEKSLQ